MTQTVLMVAEKPSIAQTLANALSKGKYSSRKGVSPAVQVHEYQGNFQGRPAYIKVTSCAGHVYSTDFPPQYQNWEKTEPLALFSAEVVKEESNPKTRLPAHFKSESKNVDHLVLWLDCDREGENICFEVIRNVKPNLSNPKSIWRAKFSSLAPSDLLRSYEKLGYPNENESLSVDARQEIDLKIGVAFTRFQTRFFQGKYGDLDSTLVSYGPCQTPTLWFCVKRHQEIQTFQPETFYCLEVALRRPEDYGQKNSRSVASPLVYPTWTRGRLFDQRVVLYFKELLSESVDSVVGGCTVVDVKKSEEKRTKPKALDTVSMLKMASSKLGIGPHQAMHIAERLYLQGYITYPRTETSKYPSAFDLKGTISGQVGSPLWGDCARDLLNRPDEFYSKPRSDGHDAGDHPPITPVRLAHESELDHDSWRVYEMVVRNFLASVSKDCRMSKIKVTLEISGEFFELVTEKVVDPGFLRVHGRYDEDGDAVSRNSGGFSDLVVGQKVFVDSVAVVTGKTSPPPYLSESDLLSQMEKHAIGTDASMATHINNICERNFVQLAAGRRLVPTKLGIVLVNGYSSIDPELVTPKVRSDIEGQCTLIALGKAKCEDVVKHSLSMFRMKFEYFSSRISKMDALFESTFTTLAQTGKPLSRCGKCKKYMNLIDKKPVRLFCRHCDEAHGLPHGGTVRLYKELVCPLDGFELVLISHPGSGGKTYPVCPYCYNNPPFEGMNSMNCHQCPHATCRHSLSSLGIIGCPNAGCNGGMLCLDPESKPKWRLDCNSCNYQLKLFGESNDVHKITVLDDKCETCANTKLIQLDYHKDKASDNPSVVGCILCDEELNANVEAGFSRVGRISSGAARKGKHGGKFKRRMAAQKSVDPRMTFDQF